MSEEEKVSDEPAVNGETVLTVINGHYNFCGLPPTLTTEGQQYTAYFENNYGEQVIIQYDREKKLCRMWHGDVGWEEELRVVEFRGRWLVVFARSHEERHKQPKCNEQFLTTKAEVEATAIDEQIRKACYAVARKAWGKPLLTDKECEFVTNNPTLNKHEHAMIAALWSMWSE